MVRSPTSPPALCGEDVSSTNPSVRTELRLLDPSSEQPTAEARCKDLAASKDEPSLVETWAKAARLGDKEASEKLFQYLPQPEVRLLPAWVRRSQWADFEDILQECLKALLLALPSYDPTAQGGFLPWAKRVAANAANGWSRVLNAKKRKPSTPVSSLDGDDLLEARDHGPRWKAELDDSFQIVAGRCHRETVLRYVHDLTIAEVAEITGTPMGTIAWYLADDRNSCAPLRESCWCA